MQHRVPVERGAASTMNNPLLRKLANFTKLSEEESDCRRSERATTCANSRAREDVISQGDRTGGVKLLLEGFACRYKVLEDGRRQIVAYFVPGDLCDLRVFILKRMDHSIGAMVASKVATISPENMLKMTHTYPTLTRALWWSTLVEEAIAREWIVNVGQRNALERMAHLFCELLYRFRAVGLNRGQLLHSAPDAGRTGGNIGIVVRARQSNPAGIAAAETDHPGGRHVDDSGLDALKEVSFFNRRLSAFGLQQRESRAR